MVRLLDINNVFLSGDFYEEILMEQPLGFKISQTPTLVFKLDKALYGLRQAPRAWFYKLHNDLIGLGFASAKAHQSHFVKFTLHSSIYLLIF